jgi:hypothetical protein
MGGLSFGRGVFERGFKTGLADWDGFWFSAFCCFCLFLGASRVFSSTLLSGAFLFVAAAAGCEADSALILACSFFQFDESPAIAGLILGGVCEKLHCVWVVLL